MTQMIKVYRLGDRGIKIEEVNLEEAERLLKEAHAWGRLVVNKKEGKVISKVDPDVEELLVIEAVSGG